MDSQHQTNRGLAADTTATFPRRLLGIWAHPDDEAYLSSGLMGQIIDNGGSVTLITLTDGEGGFPADDKRSAEERASIRRHELTDAMSVIGVNDISHYGYTDGALATEPVDTVVARLADVMRSVRPDVVVTFGPDGMTGHCDHIANCAAVTKAWLETGIGQLWYATKDHQWFERFDALHHRLGLWMSDDYYAAASDELCFKLILNRGELDRKRKVLAAHTSQTELVAEAMGEAVYQQWIAGEMFRRPSEQELFDCDPQRSIAAWCHPNNQTWRRDQ